jgi:hypothetical protein
MLNALKAIVGEFEREPRRRFAICQQPPLDRAGAGHKFAAMHRASLLLLISALGLIGRGLLGVETGGRTE